MPPYLPDPGTSKQPPVWLVRLLSALLAIGVLIVAIFLGGVILVTGAVLGVALWGWLWWQRRKMMKVMERDGVDVGVAGVWSKAAGFKPGPEQRSGQRGRGDDNRIIEGDFEVLDDRPSSDDRRRPR